MSSALTFAYFEITAISSLCRAGRKSGPSRPLRSRAMITCRRSLAALALLGLLLNRNESSVISLTLEQSLEQAGFLIHGKAQRYLVSEEARHHILVGFGNVGAGHVDGRIALVGCM